MWFLYLVNKFHLMVLQFQGCPKKLGKVNYISDKEYQKNWAKSRLWNGAVSILILLVAATSLCIFQVPSWLHHCIAERTSDGKKRHKPLLPYPAIYQSDTDGDYRRISQGLINPPSSTKPRATTRGSSPSITPLATHLALISTSRSLISCTTLPISAQSFGFGTTPESTLLDPLI